MDLLGISLSPAEVGDWAAIPLMLFGLCLCTFGSKIIRVIVALAAFVPVSITVYALATSFGGLSSDDASVIAGVIGLMAAVVAARMYKKIHIMLGGAFGLVVMSVILSIVNTFYLIESMVFLLLLDVGFIIGAKVFGGWKEELHFTAPSAIGSLFISAGWSLWVASAENLSQFDPFATTNAIIIFVAMMGGAYFQMWMFGIDGYLDRRLDAQMSGSGGRMR